MQTVRNQNRRLPQHACKVYRAAPARNMSFFPRYIQSEFAPMFRLLEDYSNYQASGRTGGAPNQSFRSFQPRFDVKETKEGYELQGELPGIDQKDVTIEFTDAQTLSIHGRTERHHEEGTRPTAAVEGETVADQTKITEGEAQSETSSYHKASVEDESNEATMSGGNPDATPAETPAASTVGADAQQEEQAPAKKSDGSKFWVSERSVGEFSRTFSFPGRVDHESVKASLKNGILSVLIPKAAIPENKRISIE